MMEVVERRCKSVWRFMNKVLKPIVAGGRDFNDFDLLDRKLTALLSNHKPENVEIVSGRALGADALGVKWAKKYGYKWL